jgi:hypothetical protein
MSQVQLTTLRDLSKFQLDGVSLDYRYRDGHLEEVWISNPSGEKFVIRSGGYLDICRVEPGSVLDIPIE